MLRVEREAVVRNYTCKEAASSVVYKNYCMNGGSFLYIMVCNINGVRIIYIQNNVYRIRCHE